MPKKSLLIAAAVMLGFVVLYQFSTRPTGIGVGENVKVTDDPLQEELPPGKVPSFLLNSSGYAWTITPKARYRIAARVLSTRRYRTGWQSTLSPIDFALGWGELGKREADQWIRSSQSGRWYYYTWNQDSPYQRDYIIAHSSNVHIIPATESLKKAVFQMARNDHVLLEGLLVDAEGYKGKAMYRWPTSLSRTDMGEGSCELLYLERLVVAGKEYR